MCDYFNYKYNMGYLELFLGPMFSGKTSRILNIYTMCNLSNISCYVVNFSEDKRYDEKKLSTHDRKMIECHNHLTLTDLLKPDIIDNNKVFLINEGQFFPDLYEIVKKLVDTYHKEVYVCGLDGDFKREIFGDILKLIPICDKVTKLNAICKMCCNGTKAIFSKRITKEMEQKVIGSDNYIPVCRKCYLE